MEKCSVKECLKTVQTWQRICFGKGQMMVSVTTDVFDGSGTMVIAEFPQQAVSFFFSDANGDEENGAELGGMRLFLKDLGWL